MLQMLTACTLALSSVSALSLSAQAEDDPTAPKKAKLGVMSGAKDLVNRQNAANKAPAAPVPSPTPVADVSKLKASKTAVSVRNQSADRYRAVGIKAFQVQKYDEAIAAFRQALQAQPYSEITQAWLTAAINSKKLMEMQAAAAAAKQAEEAAAKTKKPLF